jgi:hypothetical protein
MVLSPKQQGVCHTVALPFTLKSILRPKKEFIWPCKNIIFKKSSKRNHNPSRYYNYITKSQVSRQAKISSFKNPHIKIDPLPRGQNPSSLHSIMNLNPILKSIIIHPSDESF